MPEKRDSGIVAQRVAEERAQTESGIRSTQRQPSKPYGGYGVKNEFEHTARGVLRKRGTGRFFLTSEKPDLSPFSPANHAREHGEGFSVDLKSGRWRREERARIRACDQKLVNVGLLKNPTSQ